MSFSFGLVRFALPAALLLFSARVSFADLVVLHNSDRLTGEIQKLEKDKLTLKTLYAGTISIDWEMVQTLSSEAAFDIETESGLRMQGRLQGSDAGIEVTTSEFTRLLATSSVATINPPPEDLEQSFWSHINGGIDLGYSMNRGNSVLSQSALTLATEYRAKAFRVQLDATSLFSRQEDFPTTSKHVGSVRFDYFLNERAFAFSLNSFERDDRQRLNLRTNFGGGLGWKLKQSDRTELALVGGITHVKEDFRETDRRHDASGEALIGLNLDRAQVGRAILFTKLSLFPNIVEGGRYRAVGEAGIRIPILNRLTWNLRLYDRYDSQPPPLVRRNDFGLISSFGVAF